MIFELFGIRKTEERKLKVFSYHVFIYLFYKNLPYLNKLIDQINQFLS